MEELLSLRGTVAAVACDVKHHFSKRRQDSILLIANHGVEGDAHAGPYVRHRYLARRNPREPNLRQVHLIPCELFDILKKRGFSVAAGDLGENIATSGIDLEALPAGAMLSFGGHATVELTGLRTPCGLIDRWQKGLKRQMIIKGGVPPFRCGVMGIVRAGGPVKTGDAISVLLPNEPRIALPRL